MDKTPLHRWIAYKISGDASREDFSEAQLRRYQLDKLKQTIELARSFSPFYKQRLAGLSADMLEDLEDLQQFPFTTSKELQERGSEFLCVSQSLVKEAVTRRVRGTANSSRLYFTAEDMDQILDYYHQAISSFVKPGNKVLVLVAGDGRVDPAELFEQGLCDMTCEAISPHRKCRQGELLERALRGIKVDGFVHTAEEAVGAILQHDIDTVAGVPVQVRSLLEDKDVASIPYGQIDSVVLTSDRIHPVLAEQVERMWGSRVFYHYGTTETGLAGGVECQARQGYHLRETDLYFEVVDPSTGEPAPPGQPGEIVFTTLTRKGMPLIRYRTGDLSQFLPGPCLCGSEVRRLDRVQGRLEESAREKLRCEDGENYCSWGGQL